MTDYEKRCAEACQWCAKGNPTVYPCFGNGKAYHSVHETEYEPGEPFEKCTAPTKDQYIEELVQIIKELHEQNEKLYDDTVEERDSLKAQVEQCRRYAYAVV